MKDYTIVEVAKELRVSETTIRRWLKSGYLKHYKIGRQYRIMQSTIDELKQGANNEKN